MGALFPKTIVSEAWARRALNFMFMSHALTENHGQTFRTEAEQVPKDEASENAKAEIRDHEEDDARTEVEDVPQTEQLVWVCHVCHMRNPHDSQAGPMSQLEMWKHYLAMHETKESSLKKRPTPKLMILREPWEVNDEVMSKRREQAIWMEC